MSTNTALKFAVRKQADFYATLSTRVNEYFAQNNIAKTGNFKLYFKSFVLLSLYILPLIAVFVFDLSIAWTLFAYLVTGIGMTGIGFSIMHDANHGSYSRYKWVNSIMGYTMHIIGGNSASWKIQHNLMHHTFTNIHGHDEDIADKPILRLSPEGKWYPIHQLQQYYALVLYGLSTLSWAALKDFSQIRRYEKEGKLKKIGVNPNMVYAGLALSKVFYLSVFFLLPYLIGHAPYYVYLLGFLVMHLFAGIATTVVFQLAHVVEHTDYFQPDDEQNLQNSWAVHQMLTTCNFAQKNKLLSWYVGGLNYQIEHHLFTHISHIHYAEIAPIVKKTAEEFDVPYYEFRTFWQAVASHWQMLGKLGRKEVVSVV